MRTYCLKMQWEIFEYVDRASGADGKRPAYKQMMCDVDHGLIDMVLVWSVNRLGRDIRQMVDGWERLKARGVHFRSYSESIDTMMPGSEMLYKIMAIVGDIQLSGHREAVKAGMRRAIKQGSRVGRPELPERKRKRVIRARDEHPDASYLEISRIARVPKSTVYKILNTNGGNHAG